LCFYLAIWQKQGIKNRQQQKLFAYYTANSKEVYKNILSV